MHPVLWCHCSDAHLGYKQYNLSQRLHDFGRAFDTCISMIVEEHPDFVIFTGDLFEHYNPNPPELRQAIAILNKLKEPEPNGKAIPIYVSPGNHDVSYSASKRYGGDILDFLEDLQLVRYIKDSYEIVEKNGHPIALLAGLRYYGKNTPQKLKEFYDENQKAFQRTDIPKILMLHAFVEGTVASFDIGTYGLNQYSFDYIAVGHYHIRWPKDFKDKTNKIFYPGGTEHRTSAEWGHKRGFITVKAEENGGNWELTPKFTTFDVRPKKLIRHDFGVTTAKEVMTIIRNLIAENDKKDLILRLILQGTLKKGEFAFLNFQNLKNAAENVLYIDITNHISTVSIGPTPPKTDREAFEEVFKTQFNITKAYLPNYITLIENLIKIADDRDFNELNSKMLEEFVSKTPEAIPQVEGTDINSNVKEKSLKSTKKSAKKSSGTSKKKPNVKNIRKINSFS
ncbi:MAG: metallophosphoesterase family protein [Candidatus Helarchaeota archaeon]